MLLLFCLHWLAIMNSLAESYQQQQQQYNPLNSFITNGIKAANSNNFKHISDNRSFDASSKPYDDFDLYGKDFKGILNDHLMGPQPVTETPEVKLARQQHLAIYQAALKGEYSKFLPQPVQDTAEVQAAKWQFFKRYNIEQQLHRQLRYNALLKQQQQQQQQQNEQYQQQQQHKRQQFLLNDILLPPLPIVFCQ